MEIPFLSAIVDKIGFIGDAAIAILLTFFQNNIFKPWQNLSEYFSNSCALWFWENLERFEHKYL